MPSHPSWFVHPTSRIASCVRTSQWSWLALQWSKVKLAFLKLSNWKSICTQCLKNSGKKNKFCLQWYIEPFWPFYRLDSDFPIPYAWVDRTLPLPAPQGSTLLQRFIASHGKKAVTQGPNLAENKVIAHFHSPKAEKSTFTENSQTISVWKHLY